MKKQLLTIAAALGLYGAVAQNSNTYQNVGSVTTSGYSFSWLNDVINDGSNFMAICSADSGSKGGMAILKTDINSGTSLTGKVYYSNPTTNMLGGQRILSISGNYYVLAGYTSGATNGAALLKISASTGSVVFSETVGFGKTACTLRPYQSVDMAYDGSTYLYAVGNIPASNAIWVAKFDLSGTLQWSKKLAGAGYNVSASNIYYQNDTAIYIGGGAADTSNVVVPDGLMLRIDNNANVLNSKIINYSLSGPISTRINSFNLVRNSSNLYAVACSHIGADGIGPMLVEKLDLNMNDVAHTLYSGYLDDFWFQSGVSKIYINHSHIIVPGVGLNNLHAEHYVNAFFNLNTTFANANILNSSAPNVNYDPNGICTYPYPSTDGYIYTFAQKNDVSNEIYFSKGSQDHDYTAGNVAPCDTTYPFVSATATVAIATITVTTSGISDKVCSLSTLVSTPNFTYTNNCFFCPPCQKESEAAGIENNTLANNITVSPNPSSGEVNFAINLAESTNLNFNVVNALGQIVLTKTENNVNNAVITYNLSSLGKGLYFVNITDSKNNKMIKKIIIE